MIEIKAVFLSSVQFADFVQSTAVCSGQPSSECLEVNL